MDLGAEEFPGDEWQPLNLPTAITLKQRRDLQSPASCVSEDERFESPIHDEDFAPEEQHLPEERQDAGTPIGRIGRRGSTPTTPVALGEVSHASPPKDGDQQEEEEPPQLLEQREHQHQHQHHQQTREATMQTETTEMSPPRILNNERVSLPSPATSSPPSQVVRPAASRSPLDAVSGESPGHSKGSGTGRQELQEHERALLEKTMKLHGSSFSNESPPLGAVGLASVHERIFATRTLQQSVLSPGAQLAQLKEWASKTFRTSWQALNEKLGNAAPTVDVEVQQILESILSAQKAYDNIQRLVSLLINHFEDVVRVQKQLSAAFGELGVKSPELADVFNCNHDAQKTLCKNGVSLIGAMTFFVQNLHTLTSKTMEDTIDTYRELHSVRLEYDAFKQSQTALEAKRAPRERIDEVEAQIEKKRKRMEDLREVFKLKAQLLDENRLKVVHKQLLLFHNATCAFFAGNQAQLEETMTKFHVPQARKDGASSSW